MRRLRGRGAAAPLAAVLLLGGCFAYRAADPAAVPAGEEVRLRLTRLGAAALPDPPAPDGTLTGRLMGREDGRLLLRVRAGVRQDALGSRDLGRDVAVPVDAVLVVERRVFDRVRTGLTVAAGAGVLVALAHAFGSGDPRGGGEVVPLPPEGVRLPLLSLPLP